MRRNDCRLIEAGGRQEGRLTRADSIPLLRRKTIAISIAAALSAYPCFNASAQDLPTNPQVVGGAATVSQSGNQQTINQSTNRAIINWGSFSIGANNSVHFNQPGSSSVILNRVVGSDPSSILGSLSANGKVFLVNPNGVFFGPGSSVDTAGLVATTMSIRNNDFMSGYFNFERTGSGAVENAGLITIRDGGYALLAADQVRNTETGVINASKGSVALTSAERVTIETNQDGLVGFSVSGDSLREVASVDNAGLIAADGGQIMLSARGAQELTGMVVNNTGVIRAQTVEEQDGVIILSGSSGTTKSSGVLDASGTRGGSVQVTNQHGVAAVAGNVKASGSEDEGGRIVVAGRQTGLFADTDIDASGTQGGVVRVGGEFRGESVNGITSQQTYVAASAGIRADGTSGDGGSVVVWADDVTRYDGHISARGAGMGKGGDAEVSGKQVLAFNGTADLRAESGRYGNLLLDPASIRIIDAPEPVTSVAPAELDGELPEIFSGDHLGEDSTIASGTLENLAANSNVTLEATNLILMEDLADNVLDLSLDSSGSLTMRATGNGGQIEFEDKNDRIQANGADITLQAKGSIDIGSLSSSGGDIVVKSDNESVKVAAVTGHDVTLQSRGGLSTSGAVSSTGSVVVKSTEGNVALNGSVSAIRNDGGTASVEVTSGGKLAVNGVTARSDTGVATVKLQTNPTSLAKFLGETGIEVKGNVLAEGSATSGAASRVEISSYGNIVQSAGTTIRAIDTAAAQFNTENEPHYAQVKIKSSDGSATLTNISAQSAGGRAQVDIETKGNITVANSGSIQSIAAAQPGISMSSTDGNINTTNATIKVTQTAEKSITENGKTTLVNPYKVVDKVGGISIDGGTLNLGRIESVSTASSNTALFGIATASRGNTTFNNIVSTNADAGISVSTSDDRRVSTQGSGMLRTTALALTADRDEGIFSLKTDIDSLTVLGGRGVDIDNTAHGSGVLTISALGRISDATTDPNTNTEIPATNKPVGGVRIQSENIEILSLENRSTNTYLYTGERTNIFPRTAQQDLRLIANNVTFIPGTIQTRPETYVQLRPLNSNRNIQLALAGAAVPANTTVYTGDQIVGLLNQFHPDSTLIIGGANAIDVNSGTNAYNGNITIGSSVSLADQISLGHMNLGFITTGRVYNNFSANPDTPSTWVDGPFNSPPYETSVLCVFGQACIRNLTTRKIYIKDSLQQSDPGTQRNIVIDGSGSGMGGTVPTGNSSTNTGGGGGDSGGGGGGGGGGGSNSNDSGPGGVNAPSDNPSGGGNAGNPTPEDGTTQVVNNPGQGTGNPGGSPGNNTNPTTPGDPNTGLPQDSSDPVGDPLAGGGSFSGDDGGTGTTSPGGGSTSGGGNNQGANDPVGGGTYSDGTPGSSDTSGGTQVAGDPGTNDGFTGGGSSSNGGGFGTGNVSDSTNTSGTGTTGSIGGGSFSDGSGTTADGTQLANNDGSGSGGFTGGGVGAGAEGSTGGGASGSIGGALFSDGTGSASGGTSVAGGSGAGAGDNAGGFTGGGSGSHAAGAGGAGGAGGIGGATFSDGSGTTAGGTQLAAGGGSDSGYSGTGQSGSSATQGLSGEDATEIAGTGNFTGGASGTSGSSNATSDTGVFSGGASSTIASGSGTSGSAGGANFSDGSTSETSSGTLLANTDDLATDTESDVLGGTTADGSTEFAGGASRNLYADSGTGASEGQPEEGSAESSVFKGGASGGGTGDATLLAENSDAQEYPECGDEGENVKQVSRAGQPYADIVQVKATGVRIRSDGGTLSQQRASCARASARN